MTIGSRLFAPLFVAVHSSAVGYCAYRRHQEENPPLTSTQIAYRNMQRKLGNSQPTEQKEREYPKFTGK